MSSPRVEDMRQWLQDATPEQREELERIAETAAETAVDCTEKFNRLVDTLRPGLRRVAQWMESPEGVAIIAHFEGIALLVETFNELQDNPVIQGSPLAADFVRNVLDEFDKMQGTANPSDALASSLADKIQAELSNRGKDAVNSRKDRQATPELKEFAIQLYHQGPFSGGQWADLPTAARTIELKVNAKAAELGWKRKKTLFSYQVIQGWIEKGLEPTE